MNTKVSKELQKRRRRIDPSKIKKHSDIVRRNVQSDVGIIHGEREKTSTGFIVKGFFGKNFETFIQVMMKGTSTPVMRHEKKDRTVRVMSGMLVVVTDKPATLMRGQEVALERGTEYKFIAATGDVEFIVTQSAKYAATLEILDDSEAVYADLPAEDLAGFRAAPPVEPTRRRGSKAKEQLAARSAKSNTKGREMQLGKATSLGAATVSEGFSPQPTMGRFDDSTAG